MWLIRSVHFLRKCYGVLDYIVGMHKCDRVSERERERERERETENE